MLAVAPLEPLVLVLGGEVRLGLPGEREVVPRVPLRDGVVVRPVGELFLGELPDRLEHREPVAGPADERHLDQRGQPVERVEPELFRAAHDPRGLEGPAPAEHRKPGEQPALGFVQQVVAPGDGAPERPLPFRQRADAGRQQGQPRLQPRQHLLRGQDAGPGRGELDRERQAIEAGRDLGDRGGVGLGHLEPRVDRRCPLHEQPHRVEPAQVEQVRHALGVRRRERRHRVLVLAPDREQDARRDQHAQTGRRLQEPLDHRRRRGDLFEVVDDEQLLAVPEVVMEGLLDRAARVLRDAERAGHGGGDHGGVHDVREVDEARAVVVVRQRGLRDLQREAGLPGAACAGQCEQPGPLHERTHLGDLVAAPHERGQLRREIVGAGIERPGRGELRREAVHDDVGEALGPLEVLEPVVAEVPKGHAVRQPRLDLGAGGAGHHDLPPVRRRRDAGGPVDVDPDVVVAAERPLPRVQAHPRPDVVRQPGEPALGLDRRGDSLRGVREHHEERVAGRADLDAAVVPHGPADHLRVLIARGGVPLPEFLEQLRRALDVGEQERDRPGRQLGHGEGNVARRGDGTPCPADPPDGSTYAARRPAATRRSTCSSRTGTP